MAKGVAAPQAEVERGKEEEVVTARVVSSKVAPFKWAEDEPDLDDEILRFETPRVKRRARVVSSQVAPFKWVSDDE